MKWSPMSNRARTQWKGRRKKDKADDRPLAGDRKGTWSLFVTKNWRITLRVAQTEIVDLNYEDYH